MIDKLKDDCCGCGVCVDTCSHKAISFKMNDEGFLYPVIDDALCSECGLCELVCPILHVPKGNPIKVSYAASSSIKPLNSSSGGLFSAFATYVLGTGGVVYGAAYDDALHLKHCRVSSVDELDKLCGSKYVQSDCTGIYRQVKQDLKSNDIVLFVGTPCQVAGLKNYLKKEYSNLYLLDLVCHGVPSPGIFDDYIHYCSAFRNSRLLHFQVRDNREGWDNRFRSSFLMKNNKEEYNSMLANLWNRIFFSELAIRKSCGNCKFAHSERVGDLTLGDFWGIEKVAPEMYDRHGVSLVLANTAKGQLLFDAISQHLSFSEAYTSEEEHPNLYHSTVQNPQRDAFMSDYSKNGFGFVVNKYFGYNKKLDFKIRIYHFFQKILKR